MNEIQNEYWQKKQAKEATAKSLEQSKLMKRAFKWIVGIGILGTIGYLGFRELGKPVATVPGEFFPAQNREHIANGAPHPAYNSNPPTGGWHYAAAAQTGIYDQVIPDETLVHNLEHGHIWIAYRPDLPADQVESLAKVTKSYSSKIIMAPRPDNPKPISLVAWEYLLHLDGFNEEQVKGFIAAHRGKGPEQIPDFGFDDFRGKTTPTPAQTMNQN